MSFIIHYEDEALKTLKKINKRDRERLAVALELLRTDPTPTKSKKLVGYNYRSVRVGNYRIVYYLRNQEFVVVVVRVDHRSKVFIGLPPR